MSLLGISMDLLKLYVDLCLIFLKKILIIFKTWCCYFTPITLAKINKYVNTSVEKDHGKLELIHFWWECNLESNLEISNTFEEECKVWPTIATSRNLPWRRIHTFSHRDAYKEPNYRDVCNFEKKVKKWQYHQWTKSKLQFSRKKYIWGKWITMPDTKYIHTNYITTTSTANYCPILWVHFPS